MDNAKIKNMVGVLHENHSYATDVFILVTPFIQRYCEKYKTQITIKDIEDFGYTLTSNTFMGNGSTLHRVRHEGQLTFMAIRTYAYTLWKMYKAKNAPKFIEKVLANYETLKIDHSVSLIPKDQWPEKMPGPLFLSDAQYHRLVVDLINDSTFECANDWFICQTPLNKAMQQKAGGPLSKARIRMIVESLGYVDLRKTRIVVDYKTDGLPDLSHKLPGNHQYKTAVFVKESVIPFLEEQLKKNGSLPSAIGHLYAKFCQYKEKKVA